MQYGYLQKQQIVADLTAVPGIQSVVPIEGVKDLLGMIADGSFQNGLPGIVVPTSESPESKKVDSQHNDRVNVWTCYLIMQKTATYTPYDVEKMKDAGAERDGCRSDLERHELAPRSTPRRRQP